MKSSKILDAKKREKQVAISPLTLHCACHRNYSKYSTTKRHKWNAQHFSIRFTWILFQFRLVRSIIFPPKERSMIINFSSQMKHIIFIPTPKPVEAKKRKIIAVKLSIFYYGEPIFAHFIIISFSCAPLQLKF